MSVPMSAFDIAASGMSAQRIQMDVIAQNLANANIERADGVPYRAQTALFEPADETAWPGGDTIWPSGGETTFLASNFAQTLAAADDINVSFFADDASPVGVRFAGVTNQQTDTIDPISQMIGLIAAGRAYDADVSALQAVKQMDVQAANCDEHRAGRRSTAGNTGRGTTAEPYGATCGRRASVRRDAGRCECGARASRCRFVAARRR